MLGALLLAAALPIATVGHGPATEAGQGPAAVTMPSTSMDAPDDDKCFDARDGALPTAAASSTRAEGPVNDDRFPGCKEELSNRYTPATHLAALSRPERATVGSQWSLTALVEPVMLLVAYEASLATRRRARAVARVQAAARGLVARRRARRRAARTIQYRWRICRLEALDLVMSAVEEFQAATVIQSWARQREVVWTLVEAVDDFTAVADSDLGYAWWLQCVKWRWPLSSGVEPNRPSLFKARKLLSWGRSVVARIQAAARGLLVRRVLRPLLSAAPRKASPSTVAYIRTIFGRVFDCAVFDKSTRRGMPMGTLLARCGITRKKATSARRARAHKAGVAAATGGSNPGRIVDAADGALYLVGGSNGVDEAFLRKRVGARLASLYLRQSSPGAKARIGRVGDNESSGSDCEDDDVEHVELMLRALAQRFNASDSGKNSVQLNNTARAASSDAQDASHAGAP